MNRDQGRGWGPRGGRGPATRGYQGRSNPRNAPHPQPHRHTPQPGGGIYRPFANDSSGNKEGLSTGEMGRPRDVVPCSSSMYTECKPTRSSEYRNVWRPSERKDAVSCAESLKEGHNSTEPGGGIYRPSTNDSSGNKEGVATGEMGRPRDVVPYSSSMYTERKFTRSSEYRNVWRPSERKDAVSCAESLKEGHNSTEPGGGTYRPSTSDSSGNKEGVSTGEMGSPGDVVSCSRSMYSEREPTRSSEYRNVWCPSERKDAVSCAANVKEGHNSTEPVEVNPKEVKCPVASNSGYKGDISSLSTLDLSQNLHKGVERMQMGENSSKMTGNSDKHMPSKSEAKDKPFPGKSPISTFGHQKPELSEQKAVDPPFDLCPPKTCDVVALKPNLFQQNREKRNANKPSMGQPSEIILQSGMVILKSYIPLSDQIDIVKLCRDLGLGPGGFYQPGYRDGAKLNLKMMCLGKNWDPETSKYGDHRPHDGAKPPCIPVKFFQLVENAIKDSQSLIKKTKASKSDDMLPQLTPDICLVNFYSSTGRLGLHKDHDESEQSLHRGLPVVSFSIGDAAEFMYGDKGDVELAKKITLKSGDVLIFGGKSRHIFHGVESIQPVTAPKPLLEATNLRPGRLNLTFREY